MQILHWSILILLVTVVPFLLGMVPVKVMNSFQKTPAMTYLCGWFVSFCVFELVSVPFILLERSKREAYLKRADAKKVMIIGAGAAGQMILREIMHSGETEDRVA